MPARWGCGARPTRPPTSTGFDSRRLVSKRGWKGGEERKGGTLNVPYSPPFFAYIRQYANLGSKKTITSYSHVWDHGRVARYPAEKTDATQKNDHHQETPTHVSAAGGRGECAGPWQGDAQHKRREPEEPPGADRPPAVVAGPEDVEGERNAREEDRRPPDVSQHLVLRPRALGLWGGTTVRPPRGAASPQGQHEDRGEREQAVVPDRQMEGVLELGLRLAGRVNPLQAARPPRAAVVLVPRAALVGIRRPELADGEVIRHHPGGERNGRGGQDDCAGGGPAPPSDPGGDPGQGRGRRQLKRRRRPGEETSAGARPPGRTLGCAEQVQPDRAEEIGRAH